MAKRRSRGRSAAGHPTAAGMLGRVGGWRAPGAAQASAAIRAGQLGGGGNASYRALTGAGARPVTSAHTAPPPNGAKPPAWTRSRY